MAHRSESQEKEIRKHVSEYISRESNRKSMITVTRANLTKEGKHMLMHVSVLPESAEEYALEFLKRNQDEIREHVKKNAKMGAIPWLRFAIDKGEKNRQLVDELLRDGDE